MRIAFFVLLLLNLAYAGWTTLIDRPSPVAAAKTDTGVRQLILASEVKHQRGAQTPRLAQATPPRCVSVGPFNTGEDAANAATMLAERGLDPKQRAAEGETWDGYWVYVGGLRNALEEARIIHTLEQAGLSDARIMPETAAGRRVSVGLFRERLRAERRARLLEKLGLKPEIGERSVPGIVYWLDLTLGPDERTPSTEGLLKADDNNARLEIRVCPYEESNASIAR